MTAAEILQSAQPPADDRIIEQAISELDVKIWEWAEALKSAHTQLRSAFAARAAIEPAPAVAAVGPAPIPAVAPTPAAGDGGMLSGLSAAAAAAHVPSPPPMPAEWMAKPTGMPAEWSGAAPAPSQQPGWSPSHGGHGAAFQAPAAGVGAAPPTQGGQSSAGVLRWPSDGSSWPEPGAPASTVTQEWPTWTPTDETQDKAAPSKKEQASSARAARAIRPSRPAPAGLSPEERAQKAAAEEALLSELEEAIARRVRLLRRLDPDTPIEKLVEKAKQGQAEATADPVARESRSSSASSSSWWRRK